MKDRVNLKALEADAIHAFTHGYMCSETTVHVLNKHFGLGMPRESIRMSTGFPYGFGRGGNICGAVAGATMAIGMVFGRDEAGDPKYKQCTDLTRELNDKVIAACGTATCPEYVKDYEFTTPERKNHCKIIVIAAVDAFADIMERERGIKIER